MKKILLLLCIVACYISGSAQSFTVSKSPMESGEQITVTGSGETDEAYFSAMTLITTGMTSTPNAFGSTYVQITGPTDMSFYNPTTDSPSSFKIVITNNHPATDYTITFQVKTTINSTASGSTPIPNQIKYVTVTVNNVPPVTSFGNIAKSQVFHKNDCGPGYSSDPYTYSVAAGTFTASTQAAANALADADIATHGQATANANLTCKQIYYNAAVTQNFTKNDCNTGYSGSTVAYSIAANQYWSLISQADADSKAQTVLIANGQINANNLGTCACAGTPPAPTFGLVSWNGKTQLFVSGTHGATSYKWYLDGVLLKTTTTNTTAITLACGITKTLGLEIVTACGTSARATRTITGCEPDYSEE